MNQNTVYLDSVSRPLVSGAKLVGYNTESKQPVIDYGTGETTLERARRQGWDNGEERFTDEQVEKIWKYLKERLGPVVVL